MDNKFSESITKVLRSMAAKNGFIAEEKHSIGLLINALGGIRGIIESAIPVVAFVICFSLSKSLLWSVGLSLFCALLIFVGRILSKKSLLPAIGGVVVVGISALFSLYTGRGVDNFLIGLIANAVYMFLLLLSIVIRWPLFGLLLGVVMGDKGWRKDPRKMRIFQGITLVFVLMFFLRLAVQLPMYWSENVELLGTFKLLMGIPLYALALLVSWLLFRKAYPKGGAKAQE